MEIPTTPVLTGNISLTVKKAIALYVASVINRVEVDGAVWAATKNVTDNEDEVTIVLPVALIPELASILSYQREGVSAKYNGLLREAIVAELPEHPNLIPVMQSFFQSNDAQMDQLVANGQARITKIDEAVTANS